MLGTGTGTGLLVGLCTAGFLIRSFAHVLLLAQVHEMPILDVRSRSGPGFFRIVFAMSECHARIRYVIFCFIAGMRDGLLGESVSVWNFGLRYGE